MVSKEASFFNRQSIFVLDRQSLDILDLNDRAMDRYGYGRNEISGMNLNDLGVPEPGRSSAEADRNGNVPELGSGNWILNTSDGQEVRVRFSSHQFSYGRTEALLAVVHETTNEESMEPAAAANGPVDSAVRGSKGSAPETGRESDSVELFRTLAEKSLTGVYLIQDGTFRYVNPRFAEILGYEQQELLEGCSPFDLVHPDDHSLVAKKISERLAGEVGASEYDVTAVGKDGEAVELSIYGSKIVYEGRPAIMGTMLDVTKTREAMRKYKNSLETFRDLFDSIGDAIYIQDKEGRILEVNRGAVEMYGHDRDYLVGETPEILAAPGKVDLQKTEEFTRKALEGVSQSFSWWGKRKNGEVFPTEIVMTPGSYFGEDVVITIARDISDRHKAEVEMRKSEEMFRQLFQNAPVPIALMDGSQEIRKVNGAFGETFGYSTEEIQGLDIDELIVPEEEQETGHKISERVFEGETAFHTGRRLRKDGELVDVLIYGVPVTVDGSTIAIFGIYVDITERRQAEEKVKASLKEKEVLLAEIHHRVKNNLAVITGLLELQAYNTPSEEATDVLKASQMRVNSIALIHEKLYQNENLSEIPFDRYLRELTEVIVSSMESEATNVDISIEGDPLELTIAQAIPCGLILNELLTNAYKHAFPDREEGKVKITVTSGDRVRLDVQDDGVGIPEEVSLDNPDSLGLKLIHTLAMQLEGEANFRSNDRGTRFSLEFELQA